MLRSGVVVSVSVRLDGMVLVGLCPEVSAVGGGTVGTGGTGGAAVLGPESGNMTKPNILKSGIADIATPGCAIEVMNAFSCGSGSTLPNR